MTQEGKELVNTMFDHANQHRKISFNIREVGDSPPRLHPTGGRPNELKANHKRKGKHFAELTVHQSQDFYFVEVLAEND